MTRGWEEHNAVLEKTFYFTNFTEALSFVNQVGVIAERLHHHPDISIHDYKKVTISSTTHDAGKTITDKDRELASAIDKASVSK